MKSVHRLAIMFLAAAICSCGHAPIEEGGATASAASDVSQSPPPGPFNFPTYTPDQQKEIRQMKPGEWVPVKIDRHYLILRGAGIRIDEGDYFLQLLSDANGRVTRILIVKKRGTKVGQVDLSNGRAPDGSFAMVVDVAAEIEGIAPYPETRAYCLSTGESMAVSVHFKDGKIEWRGELFGLAGPSGKVQRHP